MKDLSITDLNAFIEPFHQYWVLFSTQLGLNAEKCEALYQCLFKAYTEPQRAYHTVQHIVECLDLFYQVENELNDPIAVQMAIWFHDFIYHPQAIDNEEQSAICMQNICAEFLTDIHLDKAYNWIRATQKHLPTQDKDLNYLLDIDLAILGANPARFNEYEKQIQQEYAWVNPEIYQVKRAEVLAHFYRMQPIYQTAFLSEKFEKQAKKNLKCCL